MCFVCLFFFVWKTGTGNILRLVRSRIWGFFPTRKPTSCENSRRSEKPARYHPHGISVCNLCIWWIKCSCVFRMYSLWRNYRCLSFKYTRSIQIFLNNKRHTLISKDYEKICIIHNLVICFYYLVFIIKNNQK